VIKIKGNATNNRQTEFILVLKGACNTTGAKNHPKERRHSM